MRYFVIYKYPKDFPDDYVVRSFELDESGGVKIGPDFWRQDGLEAARRCIPEGLSCFAATKKDDPVIVETWL